MPTITAESLKDAAKLADERDKLQQKVDQAREKFETEQAQNIARVNELDSEIARLLGPAVAPAASQDGQRRRGRAPSVSIDDNAILAFVVKSAEPVGAIDIAKSLGMDKVPPALSNRLKALTDDGKLNRSGEKRGTKYAAA